MTTIALGVTVKDDRDGMRLLLDAVAAQTRLPDELIVVDAASADGTRELCEDFAKRAPLPVRVVSEPCTRGGGRARIVSLATSDLVAFTDSDCVPPPEWLATFERAWTGGRLAALGGPNVSPPGANKLQRAVEDVMAHTEAASFSGVNTCNAIYLRSAALAVGNFDATLQTAEDPDLNARLLRAGHELRRVDDPVLQRRRGTWRALARQHYEYGKGAKVLQDRYPESFPRVERHMPWILLIPPAPLVVPFWVHRRLLRGRDPLRRAGVVWCLFVPYHFGVLAARLAGKD